MINICRFCKTQFPTPSADQHVCEGCVEEMKKTVVEDPKIQTQVLEKLITDPTCMERIAKALSETPIRHFGLGGEGSFADFFRKPRKKPTGV